MMEATNKSAAKIVSSSPETDKSVNELAQKLEVGRSAVDPAPPDIWQILYWPPTDATGKTFAGAGRAEYLRVMFEEAGVEYEEVNGGIIDYFWKNLDLQPTPVLAPPAIRKGTFVLSQTAVCAKHLAVEFGMYPSDLKDASHAEQIVATVHEFIAEGRMAFHPVKNTMSYHEQKEEAKPYIEAFKKERLPRYLAHFERCINSNTNSGFFVGAALTYVDLQVMVMLQVTKSQFPDAWEEVEIPSLKKFLERMESRPKQIEYMASSRKHPFAGDSMM